jgi:hypothetical protein
MKLGDLRVYPAEISGAFGGKTAIYVMKLARRKFLHLRALPPSRPRIARAQAYPTTRVRSWPFGAGGARAALSRSGFHPVHMRAEMHAFAAFAGSEPKADARHA